MDFIDAVFLNGVCDQLNTVFRDRFFAHFREMIQKASNEVGFDAEDIPLMVEAIPLSSESVMLVITKIEDPEELDTRFSKFSPMSEDEDRFLDDLASVTFRRS